MNDYLAFWRTWDKQERILLAFSAFLFGLFLIASLYYFYFADPVHWDIYSELKEKVFSAPSFFIGDTAFAGTDIVYYIKERYGVSTNITPQIAYILSFLGILVGSVFALLALSRMSSISFFIGIALLAGFLISLHTETLFWAGNQTVFLVSFFVLGGTVFYLNSYRKYLSTIVLFGLFSGLICIFLAITFFSNTSLPLVSLLSYVGIFMILFLFLYIFFTSHEAYMGVVWLVSNNSQKGKSNLLPFIIISFIFIFNLLMVYLKNANQISKNALLIPALVLFIINSVMGLWGYRKYLDQSQTMSFQRVGVWLYMGATLMVFSFLAWVLLSQNDPWIELFEDMVSIATLVLSVAFFIHILVNFFSLISEGHLFHKVIFKPLFSPLVFARVAGLFGIVVLFLFKSDYPYRQYMAGNANALADYYQMAGNAPMAETFYKQSANYDIFNAKANLGLAQMASDANDKQTAAYYFNQLLQKPERNYAYIGLSRNLESEDMYFDAVFTLQKGLKALPNDPFLLTNMAYLQARTQQRDSAFLNLDQALQHCKKCEVEKTNMASFWIENAKSEALATKVAELGTVSYESFKANVSAMENLSLKAANGIHFKDTILNVSNLAMLYNHASNKSLQIGEFTPNFKGLKTNNEAYEEQISFAESKYNFWYQSKTEGLKQMALLGQRNVKNKNLYNQTYAMWLAREGALEKSKEALLLAKDSSGFAQINKASLKASVLESQNKQAMSLIKGISLANYKNILNKAPLNPFLIHDIYGFLKTNKKQTEAYNMLYYSLELCDESPLIIADLVDICAYLGQYDYGFEVIESYKKSLKPALYQSLADKLNASKLKSEHF